MKPPRHLDIEFVDYGCPCFRRRLSFSIDHLNDLFTVETVEMKPIEEVRGTVADGPAEMFVVSKIENTASDPRFMRGSEDMKSASLWEHKEVTRKRRATHVAVQCACIECIDKPLDLVYPIYMYHCSSS